MDYLRTYEMLKKVGAYTEEDEVITVNAFENEAEAAADDITDGGAPDYFDSILESFASYVAKGSDEETSDTNISPIIELGDDEENEDIEESVVELSMTELGDDSDDSDDENSETIGSAETLKKNPKKKPAKKPTKKSPKLPERAPREAPPTPVKPEVKEPVEDEKEEVKEEVKEEEKEDAELEIIDEEVEEEDEQNDEDENEEEEPAEDANDVSGGDNIDMTDINDLVNKFRSDFT